MKRPYIPMRARVHAGELQAERSPRVTSDWWLFYNTHVRKMPLRKRLDYLLDAMFDGEEVQLDHDPALSLRKVTATGQYRPHANNPHFLVYRPKGEHLQKTTGRLPGAARTITSKGSDVWLAKKYRKLGANKRPKRKIPSRKFAGRRK